MWLFTWGTGKAVFELSLFTKGEGPDAESPVGIAYSMSCSGLQMERHSSGKLLQGGEDALLSWECISLCFVSWRELFKGLSKISLCGHLCCRAAYPVAVVIVVPAVVVIQLTTKGSEFGTLGLPFVSVGSWDLCFQVSILHFVSLRDDGEYGKSHEEIPGIGKCWQRVSPTTVTSTQPWARGFAECL